MVIAFLSRYEVYTTFTYNDRTITFMTGVKLDKYIRVNKWDKL